MVAGGTFIKLNEKLWPGCYLRPLDPSDVARVEDRTFICSNSKEAAGPTNNWVNPFEMRKKLRKLFNGCMQGRTMYVLPSAWGPSARPCRKSASSSPTRRTSSSTCASWRAWAERSSRRSTRREKRVVPVHAHSVGRLKKGPEGRAWPCNKEKYIVHFPESARSGATAPATAATPCSARSASPSASPPPWPATRAGWPNTCSSSASRIPRARRPTSPPPSRAPAARPTSPCSSRPPTSQRRAGRSGPSATTSRGSNPDPTAACYAINPEAGFFGVAPGTSRQDQPERDGLLRRTPSSPTSRSPPTATCGGRA
jgi:phosphoenolpyruvate carboxykinase (GTP)